MAVALAPLRTPVYQCHRFSLCGVAEAAAAGIIKPTVVAPETQIRALAASLGIDLGGIDVVDAHDSRTAADWAVGLARDGEAAALMKGCLETDELMAPVVRKDRGLRAARRISRVFVI